MYLSKSELEMQLKTLLFLCIAIRIAYSLLSVPWDSMFSVYTRQSQGCWASRNRSRNGSDFVPRSRDKSASEEKKAPNGGGREAPGACRACWFWEERQGGRDDRTDPRDGGCGCQAGTTPPAWCVGRAGNTGRGGASSPVLTGRGRISHVAPGSLPSAFRRFATNSSGPRSVGGARKRHRLGGGSGARRAGDFPPPWMPGPPPGGWRSSGAVCRKCGARRRRPSLPARPAEEQRERGRSGWVGAGAFARAARPAWPSRGPGSSRAGEGEGALALSPLGAAGPEGAAASAAGPGARPGRGAPLRGSFSSGRRGGSRGAARPSRLPLNSRPEEDPCESGAQRVITGCLKRSFGFCGNFGGVIWREK